jgi:hypothetical protein
MVILRPRDGIRMTFSQTVAREKHASLRA